MTLAKNIRHLRNKNGWSQDFLAEKLGYKSYTTVQKWESGVSDPPLKTLHKLAMLFNVDMDDLNNKDLTNFKLDANITENNNTKITNEEMIILEAYRKASHLEKEMTRRCLGLEGTVEEEADRICECIDEEFNLSAPKIVK